VTSFEEILREAEELIRDSGTIEVSVKNDVPIVEGITTLI
jgi:hypothetical protein